MVNDARGSEEWEERRPGKKQRMEEAGTPGEYFRREEGRLPPPPPPPPQQGRDYEPDRDTDGKRGNGGTSGPPGAGTGARLLLANLSYATTEDEIMDYFREKGANVDRVSLVKVPPENRVNGNAYVWLADAPSVDIALDCDGREFRGRKLRVSHMPEDQRTACVRGLRRGSTERDVEQLFEGCRIEEVRCKKGGHADMMTWFVDFKDDASFAKALAKDRTSPGLMICIATAQGRRGGAGRRDSGDFGEFDERGRRDREGGDRDRDRFRDIDRDGRDARDGMDRKRPHSEIEEGRGDGHGRNGVGNGQRGRSRSRSRSPPPPPRMPERDRDRRYDDGRFGDRYYDGRSRDRYGDGDRSYGRRNDRRDDDRYRGGRRDDRDYRGSPPRDDRYRGGRDYDRGRDRDMDNRRDYRDRRDYDRGWGDRDRGRDHERGGGRDFDRRRYERDSEYDRGRGGDRGGRQDRDYRDMRYPPNDRDRRPVGKTFDTKVTTVLTNLPFCEDREHVVSTLKLTLQDLGRGLEVEEVIPVGRRCGASIVIFKDEGSYSRALELQSITVNARKVNILPLEVPSVVRVQKLNEGYNPDHIIEDMRRRYDVEALYVKLRQSDQLLLCLEESKFLVQLLDIDGRPLMRARHATVSYIPSRHYSDTMGGRSRRQPGDYDGPNRGGNSYRDRDNRDERNGHDGKDRRRDGDDRGDDRGDGGEPHRGGDSRGYQQSQGQWTIRLEGLNTNMDESELFEVLSEAGLSGFALNKVERTVAFLYGAKTDRSMMEKTLSVCNDPSPGGYLYGVVGRAILVTDINKKRSPKDAGLTDDQLGSPPKKSKPEDREHSPTESLHDVKMKPAEAETVTQPRYHISPMTPSPTDPSSPKKGKVERKPDLKLCNVSSRLATLKSAIFDREEEEEPTSYGEYFRRIPSRLEMQVLRFSHDESFDPEPPKVWSGYVKKGQKSFQAKCSAYLIPCTRHSCEAREAAVGILPKDIRIEYRGPFDDAKLTHLMTHDSIVFIVKADKDKGNGGYRHGGSRRGPKPQEVLHGIVNSLRVKQRMGISRYTLPGDDKKYVALCIPMHPLLQSKMRIPWRYLDWAGHNFFLMVVGPRHPPKKASA